MAINAIRSPDPGETSEEYRNKGALLPRKRAGADAAGLINSNGPRIPMRASHNTWPLSGWHGGTENAE